MSNYATLKSAIQQVVKTNGNNEITGALLQQSLLAMINSLGYGYQYMGIATPTTNPGTPDQNVFYIASESGTYSNFGGLAVSDGEVAIFKYNGTWTKEVTGAATAAQVTQLGQEVGDLDEQINGEQPTEYHFGELVNAVVASNGHVNAISPKCAYYIPINGGETITGKANSTIAAYYCCVKSVITASGQPADLATGFTGSISVRTKNNFSLVAPADARYLYISHINGSDASIISDPSELIINGWDVVNNEYIGPPLNSGLVQRVDDLESPHGLMSLNVCEHNEGHYNYGDTPGLPNENFDNDVMLWKSLLTKTNADFLAVTEHEHILNAIEEGVQNVDSYETLYKQFYPYKYDGGTSHQYALFSKYPIISSKRVNFSVTDRYFDKHIVNVNGVDICIVIFKGYVGVPGSSGATSRVAEFTELVSLLENEPIVIIPIDTNSQYTEDFDVFRNNGYQLGNFGYWGEKKTCGISESYPQGHYAFDNIIVKGMNINSFEVCDEHATSDHFPTMAKLSTYIV